MTYPIFVWWYKGEQHRLASNRMAARCKALDIPCFFQELDTGKYEKSMAHAKSSLSERRFLFKCGMSWLLDTYFELGKPIFYIHGGDKIIWKPEQEVFDGIDVGYSVGERGDGLRIILSHGLYFSQSTLSLDFLALLTQKCRIIRAERPTEHDLVRTTVFDFSGQLFDDKFVEKGTIGNGGNHTYKDVVRPLQGKHRKYIYSKKGDTYIRWL